MKVNICGVNTYEIKKLTEDECKNLLSLAQKGDKNAQDKVVMANVRLVLSIVKKFNYEYADDLFQVGCVGLIKAIKNFDLSLNLKLSTYAVPMILGEIKRFLRSKNGLRVPRSMRDMAYKSLLIKQELEKCHIEPTNERIAKELNVKESEVAMSLDSMLDNMSIYEPVYSKNGEELLLVDQIAETEHTIDKWTEDSSLKIAMESLEPRAKLILELRYFEGKTQTEISNIVGLSQAQVSRLEKTALLDIKGKIS